MNVFNEKEQDEKVTLEIFPSLSFNLHAHCNLFVPTEMRKEKRNTNKNKGKILCLRRELKATKIFLVTTRHFKKADKNNNKRAKPRKPQKVMEKGIWLR